MLYSWHRAPCCVSMAWIQTRLVQVRLVFERPSIREWEQQMEEVEEAQETASASSARMGVSCSAAAASTSGADAAAVGVGRCMVAQFSRPQQVRVLWGAPPSNGISTEAQLVMLCPGDKAQHLK